jgi:hypothetical protein
MIDAGVEIDVPEQVIGQQRLPHVLSQAAIAAPMIGYGAAKDQFSSFWPG